MALGTALIGGIGSAALVLYVGRQNPSRLLIAAFLFWVLAPFAALFWGNLTNRGWSPAARLALQGVTFVIAAASLAIYGARARGTSVGPSGAFVFLVVPPASWLLMVIALVAAALVSRRGKAGPA